MISQLSFLTDPSPDINYNFISAIYGLFSFLALALYILETKVLRGWINSKEDGNTGEGISESLREFAEGMVGLYWVFVPFFPCLLWSMFIRRKQPPSISVKMETKAKKND